MNWKTYTNGVRRGLPVGVGYFSVSFGFGAMAASQGIRVLDAAAIRRVVCNGALAGKLYARYLQQAVGLEAIIAPSTSPANAAWSLARLLPVWRDALGLDMPPPKG